MIIIFDNKSFVWSIPSVKKGRSDLGSLSFSRNFYTSFKLNKKSNYDKFTSTFLNTLGL